MARFVPIRITKADRKEYARLVKNTKAKLRRTKKNYGLDLSDEVVIPSLDDFTTRQEFNLWKQQMSSFTNRANLNYQFKKNPYGVVASKKEINEITRNTKRAQEIAKQFEREASEKPFISGGKQQGTLEQRSFMLDKPVSGITVPRDFDFEKVRSRRQLEAKKESMARRVTPEFYDKRMEQMKENYINLMQSTFHSDADELVRKLENMTAKDFYNMWLMFDEFDFTHYYPPSGVVDDALMNYVEKMETNIERYQRMGNDLKGF